MDFAGVAGIMAAEQEVMILGGIVMAFFLILLLIIRTAKRNDVPRASHMSGDTDRTMHGQGKPRITELTNIEGPVKEPMPDSAPDNRAGKLPLQLLLLHREHNALNRSPHKTILRTQVLLPLLTIQVVECPGRPLFLNVA